MAQARGGGSALPGLVVERIDPRFMERTLASLPHGVVLISGTNGKTTTTKMVVELLRGQGLRVFTNPTGSNFTRGVVAAMLGEVDRAGRLDADIAVLELDEAHAVHFVRAVAPQYCLFLNVMRDQLDRFGEIDATARLLHTVAQRATRGIVVNADDPRLGTPDFVSGISVPVRTYSVGPAVLDLFPSDDAMRSGVPTAAYERVASEDDTQLTSVDGAHAGIRFDDADHEVDLLLKGVYNVQNAVGAVALVRTVLGSTVDVPAMMTSLASVTPAFGRGESVMIDGQECQLVLVKNPAGFRLSLASLPPAGYATMIAINDDYADGRDMSWLWDVEFDTLREAGVAQVTGVRAYDMALRLQYDEVAVAGVTPDLPEALDRFLAAHRDQPKRIFCTYTAMLAIRRGLARRTTVEAVR